MISVRVATMPEVKEAHPDMQCSYRAWAVEMDGDLVGLIGLALTRPQACLFCWIDPRLRPHLASITVMRLVKKVADLVAAQKAPVLAVRDRKEPKAPHILKRMGFRFYDIIDGDAVYRRG